MAEKKKSTKAKTEKTTPKTPKVVKEEKTKTKERKSSKGLLFAVLGGALFIGLVLLFLFVFRPKLDPSDPKSSPTYTSSFFIYDNGKYTLWNADGKRLTEDEYSDKSAFVGGYAYVKKGNEYALIQDNGKIALDFGQISRIEDYGSGLYLVEDNKGVEHLMLGNGKILLSGDDIELDSPTKTSTFSAVKAGEVYYIYNYAGALMAKIDVADDDAVMRINASSDFGLIFYNDWNYLFDNRSGKQIVAFQGKRFTFDSVSENRTAILLEEYEDSEEYLLIKDSNIYPLNETKYYGMVRNSNLVIGYDDDSKISLLGSDYKVVKQTNADLALKDPDNYATINDDGEVEIYYRGQKVKTFAEDADLISGVLLYADLYAIENNGKYSFYHLDGSLAFGEYDDISGLFNKHGHTSVSDDGKEYYLINTSGKRLNDVTYSKIYSYEHSYLVVDADGKRAILAESGEPITEFAYTEAYNRSVAVDHEIWSLKIESNKYDIVDATAKEKLLATGVDANDFSVSYYTIKNEEDGYDYYTYTGLKFYSTQKK